MKYTYHFIVITLLFLSCNKEENKIFPDPTDPTILGPKVKKVRGGNSDTFMVFNCSAIYIDDKISEIHSNRTNGYFDSAQWLSIDHSISDKISIKQYYISETGSTESFSPWFDCDIWLNGNKIDSTVFNQFYFFNSYPSTFHYTYENDTLVDVKHWSSNDEYYHTYGFAYNNNSLTSYFPLEENHIEFGYLDRIENPHIVNTSLYNNLILSNVPWYQANILETYPSTFFMYLLFNRQYSITGIKSPKLIDKITSVSYSPEDIDEYRVEYERFGNGRIKSMKVYHYPFNDIYFQYHFEYL